MAVESPTITTTATTASVIAADNVCPNALIVSVETPSGKVSYEDIKRLLEGGPGSSLTIQRVILSFDVQFNWIYIAVLDL
ncbi:unnamed protein product [Fusarium graminearum]|nr:unnamed protein product [Fusarium graminearum]CAG1986186.1 unnamed protein product [Fusarium graminearum]